MSHPGKSSCSHRGPQLTLTPLANSSTPFSGRQGGWFEGGLRHTYATNRLNAGVERVDIQALLGHESVATTQIYTNVGQERMEQVVARL
ncbi:MAG: tyrosine-type recombinase/integrase [Gammaproteobacteria bacterium]|nr:tyrosine-type recombinase/integrase [Gammaproteobacteria bacterium]MCP5196107.1 tyrosine-type recombinase/integrase [Gammaproteobacteria bacterium]